MDGTCQTLSAAEIIDINRQAIEQFGGRSFVEPGNFANENSLLYILEAINTTYFGQDLYPTLAEKAAAIGWTVIAEHVFNDANKRTGMLTCQLFLEINNYDLSISGLPLDAEVIDIAVDIAEHKITHKLTREDFAEWVEARVLPLEN